MKNLVNYWIVCSLQPKQAILVVVLCMYIRIIYVMSHWCYQHNYTQLLYILCRDIHVIKWIHPVGTS